MTLYEFMIKKAQRDDKIIYYDYIAYKKAAGWWNEFGSDDWHRPHKIKRAKYHGKFLANLPNYYFLGFPIKELLKTCYSDGYCHACAVALSLYFKDFELITCNLKNYVNYYNKYTDSYSQLYNFEHSFIVVNIKDKKIVIDTTFGMVTNYNTYKKIFNINKVKKISSNDLKKTEVYQYIEKRKNNKGPSYKDILHNKEIYNNYKEEICKYMELCKKYSNENNNHLQLFINRCLFETSNIACFDNWLSKYDEKYLLDYRIKYPSYDMFSLTDDKFDLLLDSSQEEIKKKIVKL